LIGDQGNEADEFTKRDYQLAVDLADELELLRVRGSDRNDHSAGVAELCEQRGRQIGSGGGDEDGIERGVDRKTECAISSEDVYLRVAERGENLTGVVGKGWVAFDGKDPPRKFREQRGYITGTSADFENLVSGGELERFEHEGNDVRLRDSLAVADGQRMIFVGLAAEGFRNEFVAGDAQHGVENPRVRDSAGPELGVDHELTGCGFVGHELWLVISDQ
jgi:hypothetical protein